MIDWGRALLGPREKDIASFLVGDLEVAKEDRAFIEQYQNKTGDRVDLELVNGFLQYRRLLKICRRVLRGEKADVYLDRIQTIDNEMNLRG